MDMWEVCFVLILQGFFVYAAPETCVFDTRKPVWKLLVVHTVQNAGRAQSLTVGNMGRNAKNFLLGCGKPVEKFGRCCEEVEFMFSTGCVQLCGKHSA